MSPGIFIERRFRRSRDRETGQDDEALTWEDFSHEHVIVVLGEPGAGKTTEFEHQAEREPGANFLTIRKFLRLPLEDPQLRVRTLYLDGLDEMRADGSRHGGLDSIITRLIQLGRPRVRLSCRAADWFGELDRSQLADVAPSSQVVVVELQSPSGKEIEQLVLASNLSDSAVFLETVRRQRLDDWLTNPQTLELMIEVARQGALPATRTGLFEEACVIMAREGNRAHRQAVRASVGTSEILNVAGFLCALELIAGLGGFGADRDESDPDFPPLEDLPSSQDELRAAVGSRLFRWSEGRATPIHRTIAEFLAARALRDRIRQGLPLTRVLRLITGHDGEPPSDLRGLFAWLATLLPEHAAAIAGRHPAALILYGDPEQLSPDVKRVIFEGLEKLVGREQWLFYGVSGAQLGSLSHPLLVSNFRAILNDTRRPVYLLLTVLAILAYGRPLPDLGEDLVKLVQSEDFPKEFQLFGLLALAKVSDTSEHLSLLENFHPDDPIVLLARKLQIDPEPLLRALWDPCAVTTFMFVQNWRQPIRKAHEARYQRPSLNDTFKVLQGGEPTSVADLHAVVCDHLRTLVEEIEKGPESGYQSFWNVKGTGTLESPVPENEARSRLRSLLNPRLRPLGISAEIEGHYTGSKRADLKVIFRSMNVPVEIKRGDHRKVWTAPRDQLKAKYSIDPGAGGFGIYLVFWFGADEGQGLPKPPPGVARPSTAAEMEAALRQIYSGEEWRDIEFLCIDCSRRSGDSRL